MMRLWYQLSTFAVRGIVFCESRYFEKQDGSMVIPKFVCQ